MKKIFCIMIFFILAGGIFYIAGNIDPKKGLTVEEVGKIINGSIDKTEGEKILNSLKSIDISKLDASKQKDFLKFIESQNMFKGDRLKNFINSAKNLQGTAKELYYKVLYGSYKKNPSEFIKLASDLKIEELNAVFKVFINKYIEKSKLIDNIQNTIKNNYLTDEQRAKMNKLIDDLKK